MNEEGRVLVALGLPRAAVTAVLADPACRPMIDTMMRVLRASARDLNYYLDARPGSTSGSNLSESPSVQRDPNGSTAPDGT